MLLPVGVFMTDKAAQDSDLMKTDAYLIIFKRVLKRAMGFIGDVLRFRKRTIRDF